MRRMIKFHVLPFDVKSYFSGFVEKYPKDDTSEQDATKKGIGAFLKTLQNKEPTKKTTENVENQNKVKSDETRRPVSSPLMGIVEFLSTLATNFGDSRIVVKFASRLSNCSIRFLLLDPASQFKVRFLITNLIVNMMISPPGPPPLSV